MPLDPNDRGKLVEALLDCDCMKTVNSRNAIVRDLPSGIQGSLNLGGKAREDVNDIVYVCSQTPDGINIFLQRVRFFEGETFTWMRLDQIAREVLTEKAVPVAAAPPPATARPVASTSPAKPIYNYDVFLSHNGKDKPEVERLAKRLEDDAGLKPFLDKWLLIPGDPWQERLEEALDQSRTFAVFLGPNGTGPWENEEMRAALTERVSDRSRRVIPVLLPGANPKDDKLLPRFLRRLTWVDFRNSLADADAFARLIAGIEGKPPGRGTK
jgi:hypothetical protein